MARRRLLLEGSMVVCFLLPDTVSKSVWTTHPLHLLTSANVDSSEEDRNESEGGTVLDNTRQKHCADLVSVDILNFYF